MHADNRLPVCKTRNNYDVIFDSSAQVWEAYRLENGEMVWIGAYDTVQEANHACHKDEWEG
jgi:hypothetical protein